MEPLAAGVAALLAGGLAFFWPGSGAHDFYGLRRAALMRLWGGLGGLALALAGAVLMVLGGVGPTGLGLAVGGSALALLAVWGADVLALRRAAVLRSSTLALGLGALLAWSPRLEVWLIVALCALVAAQAATLLRSPVGLGRLLWLRQNLRLWQALLIAAVLIRIPVPLWPESFPVIAVTQISLITLAALLWGYGRVGVRILPLALAAFSIGLVIELLGSRTGFPFGLYTYAGAPDPTLFTVPLLVPLGWFSLVLSAHLLAGGRPWLTGLLVVAWDLGLEALMPLKGYWQWLDPNPFWYGAPVQNYLAWFAVGFLISWMFARFAPDLPRDPSFGWAYRLEALFIPVGLALFGLYPAAVVCGIAMNLLAWRGVRWPELVPHRQAHHAGD
ncbi:MAG: carotenoid biosynthesis protein [Meiothermus sp.]|nr:carotenoid biosynthesis protein [Meiothermus sp.]